jgi:hypothetical protein
LFPLPLWERVRVRGMRNPPFLKGESKGDLEVEIALMRSAGSLIKVTTTSIYGERLVPSEVKGLAVSKMSHKNYENKAQ